MVARLDPAGGARAGEAADIVLDAAKIKLFDPQSGGALAARA